MPIVYDTRTATNVMSSFERWSPKPIHLIFVTAELENLAGQVSAL